MSDLQKVSENQLSFMGAKNVASSFSQIERAILKGETVEKIETADYFEPDENEEYLVLVEKTGDFESVDEDTGESKRVPAVFFFAKKMGESDDPKRCIDASTVLVKILSGILKESGPFGVPVVVKLLGKVSKGKGQSYNDWSVKTHYPA